MNATMPILNEEYEADSANCSLPYQDYERLCVGDYAGCEWWCVACGRRVWAHHLEGMAYKHTSSPCIGPNPCLPASLGGEDCGGGQ